MDERNNTPLSITLKDIGPSAGEHLGNKLVSFAKGAMLPAFAAVESKLNHAETHLSQVYDNLMRQLGVVGDSVVSRITDSIASKDSHIQNALTAISDKLDRLHQQQVAQKEAMRTDIVRIGLSYISTVLNDCGPLIDDPPKIEQKHRSIKERFKQLENTMGARGQELLRDFPRADRDGFHQHLRDKIRILQDVSPELPKQS
jgi:hypothetical protein